MKTLFMNTIALVAILLYGFSLSGQPNQVIPVSPEAAALMKMVNYPVNMNTGIPNIDVPFYEINVGGMSLPIGIAYHAGGFKIHEKATRAGLGWNLTSDIQITRSINGLDDFKPVYGYLANPLVTAHYTDNSCPSCFYPFYSVTPFPYANAYELAKNISDGLPDKFTYKLLDKSGTFYFQKNNAGTGYTIVPVPYNNIKIVYDNGRFIITDSDGTVYYFGEPGTTSLDPAMGIEATGSIGSGSCTDCVRTAWKCKKIVNSTNTDEITFTYTAGPVIRQRIYRDYIEYYNNPSPCLLTPYYRSDQAPLNAPISYELLPSFHNISSPKYMTHYGNNGKSELTVPYLDASGNPVNKTYEKTNITPSEIDVASLALSTINFRGGKVQFTGTDKLSTIKITDSKNAEVKTIQFFHSYKNAQYVPEAQIANGSGFLGTLYLDSLHIKSASTTFERYAFLYKDKFCYGNHLTGHDAWGYPNLYTQEIAAISPANPQVSLPLQTILGRYYFSVTGTCNSYQDNVPFTIGTAEHAEKPNSEAMQKGILRRIIYPTGGFTDFDFEANQYAERFVVSPREMIVPQLGGGLRIRSISSYDALGTVPKSYRYYRYGDLEEGTGTLINRPKGTLKPSAFQYDAISYEQEIVYLAATGTGCVAPRSCLSLVTTEDKTTFMPASYLNYTYANGAPIYYTKVSVYQQDLGKETGKVVHEYYPPGYFNDSQAPFIADNQVQGTNFSYIKSDALMGAQKSVSTYKYGSGNKLRLSHKKNYTYTRYLRPMQVKAAYAFLRVDYQVVEGVFTGTDRDLYDNTYPIAGYSGGQEYITGEYGIPVAKLLLDKEEESWYEEGGTRTVENTYEYASLPYIQPSKITTKNSKGEVLTKTLKYANNFTGTAIYDQMVSQNMLTQVVEETRTNLTSGNEVSKTRTNYAEFPIGFDVVLPATVQRSVKGGPPETDITFNRYDSYANILQMTGRDGVPTSYIWGYGGLYPVAELKGVAYSTIPASYISSTTVIDPPNDAALQTALSGLRTYFTGEKLISTYAYKRLVGMTSQVNPGGMANYYEYDPIGRLLTSRDHDNNILSSYRYNYKGPQKNNILYPFYTNIPMMRTYNATCPAAFEIPDNFIVKGGMYNASTAINANSSAELVLTTGYTPPVGVDCPPADNTATVELRGDAYLGASILGNVVIDFIQDGSIVASQAFKFPNGTGPTPSVSLKLTEGQYQLSIHPSAEVDYVDDVLYYYFTDNSSGVDTEFQSGDTVTVEKLKEYTIMVF